MLLMWNKTKYVDQTTERSQYEEKALVPEKAPTPVMHHVLSLDHGRTRRNTSIGIMQVF